MHLKRNNGSTAVIAVDSDSVPITPEFKNRISKHLGWPKLNEDDWEIEASHLSDIIVIDKEYSKEQVRLEVIT